MLKLAPSCAKNSLVATKTNELLVFYLIKIFKFLCPRAMASLCQIRMDPQNPPTEPRQWAFSSCGMLGLLSPFLVGVSLAIT